MNRKLTTMRKTKKFIGENVKMFRDARIEPDRDHIKNQLTK